MPFYITPVQNPYLAGRRTLFGCERNWMHFTTILSRGRLLTVRRNFPRRDTIDSSMVFQLIQEEMDMTVKFVLRFGFLLCVYLISACTVRLESVRLNSSDLTFTALDGSFKVSPGEGFPIPKNTPYCYSNSSESIGSIFRANTPIASQPDVGRERGGMAVRIDIAGEDDPLYGLLLLCSMPSSLAEFSSLNKNESVTVPEKYRAIARRGEVASILRPYKASRSFKTWYFTWILWLADKREKLN